MKVKNSANTWKEKSTS